MYVGMGMLRASREELGRPDLHICRLIAERFAWSSSKIDQIQSGVSKDMLIWGWCQSNSICLNFELW